MYFNLDLFSQSIFAYDQTENGYAEISLYIPIKKINSLTVGVRRKKPCFRGSFVVQLRSIDLSFVAYTPLFIFL